MTDHSEVELRPAVRGAIYGILAAVLFGMSAPFAKLLVPTTEPLMLAAVLYLGAGAGLTSIGVFRRGARDEAPLTRSDAPYLVLITLTGGVIGPVLLLVGLRAVSGVAGSLLLNLEAIFTMLLAVLFFREHMSRLEVLAAALIVCGATALGYEPGALRGEIVGALAIAGACLSWGIDNNLTQKVSVKDPIAIVRLKTLGAGTVSLVLALAMGQRLPSARHAAAGLFLGLLSYGVSILLDAYALRLLGAAREAAFFATAPFAGALISVPLFHEHFTRGRSIGLLFMIGGVIALLRARHTHFHTHEKLFHEHRHVHDQHHQHAHSPDDPPGEPHVHAHLHEPDTHEHPHVSDVHHRHSH